MKKSILIIFVLVFLTVSCIIIIQPVKASGDFWVTKAPMPNGAANFKAVTVNGEIYAVGSNFTYVYNPSDDRWALKAPLPTISYGFAVAVWENKLYVFGGWNGTDSTGIPNGFTGANQVYDPATGNWAARAAMPTPRFGLNANVIGNKIYLIGGGSSQGTLNVSEVYDPLNDSWANITPMPIGVYDYASAVVDGKIYVIGGYNVVGAAPTAAINQIYDPTTNTWAFGQAPPFGVIGACAAVTTGTLTPVRIYVMGGGIGRFYDTNQIYDPITDSWVAGAPMLTPRYLLAAVAVNDTIYAMGGTPNIRPPLPDGTPLLVNEQYFPLDYQGSLPAPSPSNSPSSSLSPSPTIFPASTPNPTNTSSPSPSPTQSSSPTQQPAVEPTQSAQPTASQHSSPLPFSFLPLITVAVVIVVIAIVGLAVYYKQKQKKKVVS